MLELISYFNFVLALTISAAYFYQLVYLMYGLVSLRKPWIFVAQKTAPVCGDDLGKK